MGDQELIRPANEVPVNIEDEMRKSYLDYAMSVIIGRALPDVRDGLKPVHRRILYAMHKEGMTSDKRYTKCAGVVGEVIKKYHPHGDSAVYDALVRMAQDFNLRYPLIDGQGNFGSIDGDPAAAYRYTECRLEALAEELLADIAKDTVDFIPNFDESTEEPLVLPTRVPNLLINGSDGIAVGMATKIPPHNLTEVINATILLIEKPTATLDEVLKLVPGPDFPTGAYIYGRKGIKSAYETGRGQFTMRAKAAIEHQTKDKEQIVITEIPYQVNKARVIERIASLVQDKKIEGISDIRDESDREGMRIVVEIKRGEQPEIVLNNLYKHTQLQENFGMIMLAIVNGQPRELPLMEAIQHFIDHRVSVVRRRTAFDLRKAQERAHILEGFLKALSHLDAIIKLIRASKTPADARTGLIEQFDFSQRQAQAILELQLQRLTALERNKIQEEYDELQKLITEYEEILRNEKVLRRVIVKELKEVQKQYGDDRKTAIIDEQAEIGLEDLIAVEDVVITLSHSQYLKRTPLSTYRQQARGGKGRLGMKTREADFVEGLFVASTHSYILVFTNTGRVHWLKVYEIPDVAAAGRGKHIVNLVNLTPREKVASLVTLKELPDDRKEIEVNGETYAAEGYVTLVTRNGVIKKTRLSNFSNPMSRGIIAMNVDEGDELIGAKQTTGQDTIFLATHEGMAIRFPESDVRDMGRQARGVRAMGLDKDDYIVGVEVVGEKELILSVTEKGFGKRTPITQYRLQSRAGKGVINVKMTARNGKVVNSLSVTEDSEVMLITQQGKIARLDSAKIRECGRSSQGVKLINLGTEDQLAAACLIRAEDTDEDDGQGVLIQ
ncbi:MAG TPA: DNA gyrase subunit A [Terriglobia bacterium]|nr:DNA gyrase subunit A [Terriglobia bacterium]